MTLENPASNQSTMFGYTVRNSPTIAHIPDASMLIYQFGAIALEIEIDSISLVGVSGYNY